MNTCPYTQKKVESQYSWSDTNPFTPAKASAQAATQYTSTTENIYNPNLDNQSVLTVPILSILFFFIIFTIIMSVVYVYHWTKFSLGDAFVERAIYIYFAGLFILSLPLIKFIF